MRIYVVLINDDHKLSFKEQTYFASKLSNLYKENNISDFFTFLPKLVDYILNN